MLVELDVVEQRYRAVLEVLEDGAPVTPGATDPRNVTPGSRRRGDHRQCRRDRGSADSYAVALEG